MRSVIEKFLDRGIIMSAICTNDLLESIPVVRLRMDTFSKVLEEYFRRYGDGMDLDRRMSVVISGSTGVVLVINGAMRLRMSDEWYPVTKSNNVECKFVGTDLLIRKICWNHWITHSDKCGSYPSTRKGVCDRSEIRCIIDIVPDDQEDYVPGEML